MKVVLVLSQANYVKDNYLSLLKKIVDKNNLPDDVEISGVVFIKTVELKLFLKCIGLFFLGVRGLSTTLLKNMWSSVISDPRKKILEEKNIPYILVDNINRKTSRNLIKKMEPDLIINARTRNIYRKRILELPTIGCINIHHGLLPHNRGTMCDLWAWVEKREVGFSVHWMNRKIDDGNIVAKCKIDVNGIDSYIDIPMKSSKFEADVLIDSIKKIKEDNKYMVEKNITDRENYTRNPTVEEIKKIRKMGLKL